MEVNMRQILFRGKTACGAWVQGDLIHRKIWSSKFEVIRVDDRGFDNYTEYEIATDTIGQFTGLTDKNGNKIFEGDIIKIPDDYDEFGHNAGEIYEVYFCCGGFRLKPKYSKARGYWLEDDETVEVIGNIHDNPELLK